MFSLVAYSIVQKRISLTPFCAIVVVYTPAPFTGLERRINFARRLLGKSRSSGPIRGRGRRAH